MLKLFLYRPSSNEQELDGGKKENRFRSVISDYMHTIISILR